MPLALDYRHQFHLVISRESLAAMELFLGLAKRRSTPAAFARITPAGAIGKHLNYLSHRNRPLNE